MEEDIISWINFEVLWGSERMEDNSPKFGKRFDWFCSPFFCSNANRNPTDHGTQFFNENPFENFPANSVKENQSSRLSFLFTPSAEFTWLFDQAIFEFREHFQVNRRGKYRPVEKAKTTERARLNGILITSERKIEFLLYFLPVLLECSDSTLAYSSRWAKRLIIVRIITYALNAHCGFIQIIQTFEQFTIPRHHLVIQTMNFKGIHWVLFRWMPPN